MVATFPGTWPGRASRESLLGESWEWRTCSQSTLTAFKSLTPIAPEAQFLFLGSTGHPRALMIKTLLCFSYFKLVSGKQCSVVDTCVGFGVGQPKHNPKSINFWLCDLEQVAHCLVPQLHLKNGDNNSTYCWRFSDNYNADKVLSTEPGTGWS